MQEPQTDLNSSTTSSAIQVVEAFLDAMRLKDLPRGLALLSEDIVYQNVPFPASRGRAQVERVLNMMARVPGKFDIRIHHIAERAGVVLTERTDSARGPGIDLEFWVCGTFEVRNGKITLWRDYFDLASVVLQVFTSPLRYLLRAAT